MSLWVPGRLHPEKVWHLLLRVGQNPQQRPGQPSVSLGVEEAGGHPEVPQPPGPPDPVDVLVDSLGQVVVDNVLDSPGKEMISWRRSDSHHSLDIQTPGSHSSGH